MHLQQQQSLIVFLPRPPAAQPFATSIRAPCNYTSMSTLCEIKEAFMCAAPTPPLHSKKIL